MFEALFARKPAWPRPRNVHSCSPTSVTLGASPTRPRRVLDALLAPLPGQRGSWPRASSSAHSVPTLISWTPDGHFMDDLLGSSPYASVQLM